MFKKTHRFTADSSISLFVGISKDMCRWDFEGCVFTRSDTKDAKVNTNKFSICEVFDLTHTKRTVVSARMSLYVLAS